MQFREEALATLEAPEELDLPIRLTRPRVWLALTALGLAVLAGLVWAVVGVLPQQAGANGVLMYPQGSYRLQSTATGVLGQVLVTPGQFVPAGAPVVRVAVDRKTQDVVATASGKVTDVLVQPGQPVTAGTPLALIERVSGQDDRLVAALYLPGADAAAVRPGQQVDIDVESAPARTFGALRGTVVSVEQTPQTKTQMMTFLSDNALVDKFAADGPTVQVVVELQRADTPSGYEWSTGSGPPFQIACRTTLTAAIRLPSLKPIQLVLPR